MIRRLAFFVEGKSEMLFIERLATEVAGAHNVVIEQTRVRGGVNVPRSVETIQAAREVANERFYILIVDCGGDGLVKSRIIEEHQKLTDKGYEKIIGIRDVRPDFSRQEVELLKRGLMTGFNTNLAPVAFILSVMEIEAWFLAEFNHYRAIHSDITVEAITARLGFDPVSGDPSERDNPAEDLDATYKLAGRAYKKNNVERTVNALDFNYIYCEMKDRIPELRELTEHLDSFLS